MSAIRARIEKTKFQVGDLFWNEDRDVFELVVLPEVELPGEDTKDQRIFSVKPQPVKIGRGLVYSKDFQKCFVLARKIFKYDHPPFVITNGDPNKVFHGIPNLKELLERMFEMGKKGLAVQRYKGLGEMNPDQLWETTMNPEKRNLLQVRVEDAVDADEVFTILMGDEVEPRRDFIQSNALEVSMLDI